MIFNFVNFGRMGTLGSLGYGVLDPGGGTSTSTTLHPTYYIYGF